MSKWLEKLALIIIQSSTNSFHYINAFFSLVQGIESKKQFLGRSEVSQKKNNTLPKLFYRETFLVQYDI